MACLPEGIAAKCAQQGNLSLFLFWMAKASPDRGRWKPTAWCCQAEVLRALSCKGFLDGILTCCYVIQNGTGPRLQDAALQGWAVDMEAVDIVVDRIMEEDSHVTGN